MGADFVIFRAEEIAGIDARIEPEGEHPPPPETNGAQSSPAPPSSDVESEQRVNDDRSDITDEQPTGRRSRSAFARKASARLQASQTPASKVAGPQGVNRAYGFSRNFDRLIRRRNWRGALYTPSEPAGNVTMAS